SCMESGMKAGFAFCGDSRCEVRDCEHLNDLAHLDSRIYALWLIVNAEDLGRPIPSREESSRASDELDRLLEKQHKLTRRTNCDCHQCRENGWWVSTGAKPERKCSLEDFIASGSED